MAHWNKHRDGYPCDERKCKLGADLQYTYQIDGITNTDYYCEEHAKEKGYEPQKVFNSVEDMIESLEDKETAKNFKENLSKTIMYPLVYEDVVCVTDKMVLAVHGPAKTKAFTTWMEGQTCIQHGETGQSLYFYDDYLRWAEGKGYVD